MPPSTPLSADDIDLLVLATAVKRRLRPLLLGALAIGAGSFVAASLVTPKYLSQTQIEIVSKGLGNPFELRREGGNTDTVSVRMDKEAIGTHVRALQSADLALKVSRQLGLAAKAEFNSAAADRSLMGDVLRFVGIGGPRVGESDEERVLRTFSEALRVYQIKDTRGIVIEFRSEDSGLAAEVTNRLAEVYRDDLALRTVKETQDASAKLAPQIRKLAEEVAEAEAEVTRFRGKANIFDVGRERSGLNEQQLGELTAELTRAATATAEAMARARQARNVAALGSGETLPDVQKSQLVPRLVEQRVRVERQIAELSVTLLPAHPRMKQLSADLLGLNQQIKVEVEKIVDGLEREAKVAASREEGVRQRIEDAKTRVVSAGADDVRLRAMESLAKSKRTELERLQAQLEAARTTADALAVPVEVQIISRGRASSEVASPKPTLIALLAALGALLLGLAYVVTRELLGPRRYATDGALVTLGAMRAASRVASVEGKVAAPIPPLNCRTVSSAARYLISQSRGRAGFRIVVAGEAASTRTAKTAVDLARQLSGQGRQVIVIDWSPQSRDPVPEFGVSATLGVTDVLAGCATFEDVVERMPGSATHFIAAGSNAEGAAVAIDKDRVSMLLDALDEAYDLIVIAGAYGALRDLFVTIEGSVDVGIVVTDPETQEKAGNFLGLDVADLKLVRYEPVPAGRGAVATASVAAIAP